VAVANGAATQTHQQFVHAILDTMWLPEDEDSWTEGYVRGGQHIIAHSTPLRRNVSTLLPHRAPLPRIDGLGDYR